MQEVRPVAEHHAPLDIVRLARLARALEAGGIYNGAKLLRALIERDLIRTGSPGARDDEAATGAGVAALVDELAAADEDPSLIAALRAAARAATDRAPLLLVDAPTAWTCRGCGRVSIGSPPDPCPDCESPAAMAREQAPVWYLEPMTAASALAELEAGLPAVAAAVEGRDEATLTRRPRDDEWSAREVLEHLVSAEELLANRVPRLLDEPDPELVAAAAWVLPAGDEATTATGLPTAALVARHRALRESTLARLRAASPAAWSRAGRHPEWGTVTVTSQAAYFARHLWSHLAQLRAAVDGRVPGEPGEG
jgi:hypothetical protein